jgi:hypothetical protein
MFAGLLHLQDLPCCDLLLSSLLPEQVAPQIWEIDDVRALARRCTRQPKDNARSPLCVNRARLHQKHSRIEPQPADCMRGPRSRRLSNSSHCASTATCSPISAAPGGRHPLEHGARLGRAPASATPHSTRDAAWLGAHQPDGRLHLGRRDELCVTRRFPARFGCTPRQGSAMQ